MTLAVQATGTQTAVIGTEHILVSSNTTAGVWEFLVDTTNLALGDELELRAYVRVLSGDSTEKLAFCATYMHPQGDGAAAGSSGNGEVLKMSPPVVSPYAVSFTLKQLAGTGRSFKWRAATL